MNLSLKQWIGSLLLLGLLLCGGGWYWSRGSAETPTFRVATIKRGELLATISASGVVQPEEVVDVGAQVAGLIDSFGKDPKNPGKFIDYRTEVEQGTVLAHIDESLYSADVDSAKAAVDQAKANVQRAEADLGQMKAKLVEAQRNWNRAQKIGPSDALSQNDYDMYQANYETAKATVGVGDAAVLQAQKAVDQVAAELKKAQRNLTYCTITSPVKGVIIDRRVNIGQTVVSSLSAPSLFLIAKDLTRMQVWASVNEADVGNVYPGQPVTFTVDAIPNRLFDGSVGKVRLNANMTQNVVTFTVEILTDNADGKLLPYLTANVQFQVAKKQDVLLAPNAALRWNPQTSQVSPDVRAEQEKRLAGPATAPTESSATTSPSDSGAAADARSRRRSGAEQRDRGFLWVKDGKFVKPIRVRVGVTDGTNTEIDGKDIADGTEIILGDAIEDSSAGNSASSPFIPQFGRGAGARRNGRGG